MPINELTVKELRENLQKLEQDGHGSLEVRFEIDLGYVFISNTRTKIENGTTFILIE